MSLTKPDALTGSEAAARAEEYRWGFETQIETETAPKGLSQEIVRYISAKQDEPQWLLDWRLRSFARWQKMAEPNWAKLAVAPIDYQDAYYWAAPKGDKPKSLDEVDPALLETYEKLGIPLHERAILAGVEGAENLTPADGSAKRATNRRRCSF